MKASPGKSPNSGASVAPKAQPAAPCGPLYQAHASAVAITPANESAPPAAVVRAEGLGRLADRYTIRYVKIGAYHIPCVPDEERHACLKDSAWAARWAISDYVPCKECFLMPRSPLNHGKKGHLWTHHDQMAGKDYHTKHPGARLDSYREAAKQHNLDVQQFMAQEAESWATPEELDQWREDEKWEAHQNPSIENWVGCRKCGKKLYSLANHPCNDQQYRTQYPGAPIESVAAKKCKNRWATSTEGRKKTLAASARWKKSHSRQVNDYQESYLSKKEHRDKRNKNQRDRYGYMVAIVRGAEAKGIAKKLAAIPANGSPANGSGNNRGIKRGTILGDTAARLTVAASLARMKPAQMAPYLYPRQKVKDVARHDATVFLGRKKNAIEDERVRLAALPDAQRNAEIEAANRKLRENVP